MVFIVLTSRHGNKILYSYVIKIRNITTKKTYKTRILNTFFRLFIHMIVLH